METPTKRLETRDRFGDRPPLPLRIWRVDSHREQDKRKMVADEDEATIVVDVGSSSVKAGFSGEDMPRAVFPSVAEDLHLAPEELSSYRARRPEVYMIPYTSSRGYAIGMRCSLLERCTGIMNLDRGRLMRVGRPLAL